MMPNYKSTMDGPTDVIPRDQWPDILAMKREPIAMEEITASADMYERAVRGLIAAIDSTLRQLPPIEQKVFRDHVQNGMSFAAVAEAHGVSVGTAHAICKRIKKRLVDHLSDAYSDVEETRRRWVDLSS